MTVNSLRDVADVRRPILTEEAIKTSNKLLRKLFN